MRENHSGGVSLWAKQVHTAAPFISPKLKQRSPTTSINDHITGYYHRVGWLPLSQLIKYHSLCTMFHQFRCDGKGIPLEPPIQFGRLTNHYTRTKYFFSHPERCRLSFTQSFFRCKAGTCCRQLLRATCSLMTLKMI